MKFVKFFLEKFSSEVDALTDVGVVRKPYPLVGSQTLSRSPLTKIVSNQHAKQYHSKRVFKVSVKLFIVYCKKKKGESFMPCLLLLVIIIIAVIIIFIFVTLIIFILFENFSKVSLIFSYFLVR